jgi:hypothetical protein
MLRSLRESLEGFVMGCLIADHGNETWSTPILLSSGMWHCCRSSLTFWRNVLPDSLGLRRRPSKQSDPKDGGSSFLWNVGEHLSDYMAPHPRGQLLLREPDIQRGVPFFPDVFFVYLIDMGTNQQGANQAYAPLPKLLEKWNQNWERKKEIH